MKNSGNYVTDDPNPRRENSIVSIGYVWFDKKRRERTGHEGSEFRVTTHAVADFRYQNGTPWAVILATGVDEAITCYSMSIQGQSLVVINSTDRDFVRKIHDEVALEHLRLMNKGLTTGVHTLDWLVGRSQEESKRSTYSGLKSQDGTKPLLEVYATVCAGIS